MKANMLDETGTPQGTIRCPRDAGWCANSACRRHGCFGGSIHTLPALTEPAKGNVLKRATRKFPSVGARY